MNKYSHQVQDILDHYFFSMFGKLDEEKKRLLTDRLELISLKRGEILFKQYDKADGIYTLLSGKLAATVNNGDGEQKVVGHIDRSETVGEMALISDENRSATIKCLRNSLLARISNKDFLVLCRAHPDFALNVARIIVKRLRSTLQVNKLNISYSSILISDVDLTDENQIFIDGLIDELQGEKEKSIHLINRERLAEVIPELSNGWQSRLDRYVSDCEFAHDKIIFDLRGLPNEVIRLLCDYSDIFLLVKDAGRGGKLSELETYIYSEIEGVASKFHLILHQGAKCGEISGTVDTLQRRPRMPHSHVHEGNPADKDRIIRKLLGTSNALVLGGGGAKGLAHLGVIKALEEHGIPIDCVGGTSMGSIIGALYARCFNAQETYETSREVFRSNPTSAMDLNFVPRISIYRDRKINSHLKRIFGNADIEDLRLPFFCISSNISAPAMYIHETGNLREAIRASMSVPGLFPPVAIDNEFYVDGGVFNNIPIDIMLTKNVGSIIACRVDKEPDKVIENPKPPSLLNTFIKSAVANSDSHSLSLREHVDIYFEPEVWRYGLLNWKAHDKIVKRGYEHAKRVLDKLSSDREKQALDAPGNLSALA